MTGPEPTGNLWTWSSIASLLASVLVSLFFLLPLYSALSLDEGGRVFFVIVASLALATGLRPATGFALLVLLLPLSIVIQRATGDTLLAGEVVDGLMLSFVCGASARLFTGRACTVSRLAAPATVLAVAVVTSTVSELRTMQHVTPREPLLPIIWHHVTGDFWTAAREFPLLHHTYRWLGWIAAAVYAERIVRSSDGGASRFVRVWWTAGMVGAFLSVYLMVEVFLGRDEPFWVALVDFWRRMRITALQPDVNAAGSYLLLFLVPAFVVGIRQRSRWLIGSCVPLLLAFAMARSRAAIGAGVLVLCAAAVAHLWLLTGERRVGAGRGRVLIAAVVLLGTLVLGGTYYATTYSHANLSDAMRIRVDLAATGLEGLRRNAAFGVGLGDYIPATRRFMTEEMTLLRAFAPLGENAHNNFLQIAVELGAPACLIFLWLVMRGVAHGVPLRVVPSDARAEGLALGVVAFLLSAAFGHPLLVPLVGATFFLAVGLGAGLGRTDSGDTRADAFYWVVSGVYLGSLLWRW